MKGLFCELRVGEAEGVIMAHWHPACEGAVPIFVSALSSAVADIHPKAFAAWKRMVEDVTRDMLKKYCQEHGLPETAMSMHTVDNADLN